MLVIVRTWFFHNSNDVEHVSDTLPFSDLVYLWGHAFVMLQVLTINTLNLIKPAIMTISLPTCNTTSPTSNVDY